MAELSSAAQAVLDAFLKTPGEEPMPGWNYGRDLAAALQAAVNQLSYLLPFEDSARIDVTDLLTLAAELDNTSPPSK
jgi:hypothetical protein